MNTYRKTAIVVGVLFIIATAFLFIGQSFYQPILDSPEYLEIAYPQRITVTIGVLLEFACVIAIPLIPVFMFPILRKHNEALAVGYVSFRLFEAVLFVREEIQELSLIGVSRDYLNRGAVEASQFEAIGRAVQAQITSSFALYVIIFAIGGLIFYSALYQSKLVPRWLSVWGLVAAFLILTGSVLSLLEVQPLASAPTFELVFAVPIAVQEMVLALWLIVKGFNAEAIAAEPAEKLSTRFA